MKPSRLPLVLSELLELAMRDYRALKDNDHYTIEMEEKWFYTDVDAEHCFVCLAGCVMANTLQIKEIPDWHISPSSPQVHQHSQPLRALESLRRGAVRSAIAEMLHDTEVQVTPRLSKAYLSAKYRAETLTVCAHEDDPDQWEKDMEKVISYLRDLGI